jgi:hypothetical protein
MTNQTIYTKELTVPVRVAVQSLVEEAFDVPSGVLLDDRLGTDGYGVHPEILQGILMGAQRATHCVGIGITIVFGWGEVEQQ